MYFFLALMACIESLDVSPKDFPDNPKHDFDGDGLFDSEDCDDSDPTIGLMQLFYPDNDLDGFPSAENSQEACPNVPLEGYLPPPDDARFFDCDDSDPAQTPADYDQDGLSSCEGDCNDYRSDVTNPQPYYGDSDGDGFGLETDSVTVCPADKPAGYVPETGEYDCDDSDSNIHPNAEELCDDNADNDCDGFIDNYDGPDAPLWYQDADGDGFGNGEVFRNACQAPEDHVSVIGDCDDTNALVYPDAPEQCDGVDNNCNTVIDEASAEDATLWHADLDNDGFGSPTNVQKSCTQPSGYIADSSDCDDSNAAINPNALELCNGLDDNCSGDSDEGTDGGSPSNASTWYQDSDGDGFGNVSETRVQCIQPQGYLADSSDCDDQNPAVYPGATEYCNALDDDCNALLDDNSVDSTTWYIDDDGDGFGVDGQFLQACEAPLGYVDNADDCDDGDPERYLGALEYCNGLDDDCNGLVDEASAEDAVSYFPDNDGDGYGQDVQPLLSCVPVAGMVSNNGDCDDILASVRPGALEYCNGLDDDCNSLIDDNALDQVDLYLDSDSDGHGAGPIVETSCGTVDSFGNITYPSNRSIFSDDCDDQDPDRNPSAPELCSETIDENCDNDPTAGAVDGTLYHADGDGDGFGSSSISLRSCTEPLGYVLDSSDCNDSDASVFPYVLDQSDPSWVDEELCNGKVDRCQNDLLGDLSPPVDELDLDGDGYVECELDVVPEAWADSSLAIVGGGDCAPDEAAVFPGADELCNGIVEDCNASALPESEIDDDGDGFVECLDFDPLDWQGDPTVIGGGDCNDSSDVTYVGAAYLSHPDECATDFDFDGIADKSWDFCPAERDANDRLFTLYASDVAGYFGYSATKVPDMDGDGIDELAVSAPNINVGQEFGSGVVYIFLGSTLNQLSGDVDAESADYTILGESSLTHLGRYIQGLDVDDDGIGDLFVSRDHGVHLYLGVTLLNGPSEIYESESNLFIDGYSVSLVARDNDINNNGSDELLFIANPDIYWFDIDDLMVEPNPSFDIHNIQYIDFNAYMSYLGSYSYYYSYGAADFDGDGFLDYMRNGSPFLSANQYAPGGYAAGGYRSATSQGDINGDSIPDIVGAIPASQASSPIRVYFGSSDHVDITIRGEAGFVGDIDQDGLDDIVVSESNQGYSHVFLGSTLTSGLTEFTEADADFVLEGDAAYQWYHKRLDDLDGDGYDDVSIINYLDSSYASQGGTLSVYSACGF